jgi:hypothetical protein
MQSLLIINLPDSSSLRHLQGMSGEAVMMNLVFAWVWILAGFLSGMALGLGFQREDWLGGYSSLPRRMLRLGHISFFGLGGVNLMFYLTVRSAHLSGSLVEFASVALMAGGITMPVCCLLMARSVRFQFLFGIPVISLIAGAILTLTQMLL